MKASYPPEVILRAREMQKNGEFHRRVVRRIPQSIEMDEMELECGHKGMQFVKMPLGETQICDDCCKEWMKQEAEKQ